MSLYYIGCAAAFPIIGPLFDVYGRYRMSVVVATAVLATSCGCTMAALQGLVPALYGLRFLQGMAVAGGVPCYTYALEAHHSRDQAYVGAFLQFGYAGICLACAAACHFGLRDFAIVSLVFGALPIAIGLAFTIAGTESLSYLVAKKRWHEARVVAQEIASWNRVQTPSRIVWQGENTDIESTCKYAAEIAVTHWGLIRRLFFACVTWMAVAYEDSDSTFRHAAEMAVDHWGLMRRLFFACVPWMAVGFSYWGLSYSARNISSEPFLNIVLLTGVDAIANFVYPVLAHILSTMFMQISSFALAGASFYFATRLPDAVLGCVLVARFAISLAFTAVYQSNYDLFPGQFRGTAFG
eukprot:CAMPEP_0169192002 /NCGR_PEP_ID=MMETSP1016-20121227/5374_1 /TAXON_ID=342587 /ORGANISM="Karlodinium micrum, Strain CCMP2283" /LENGTH=352 /DNA_ID=CAMNT_0009268297 /DNA_START=21 /DNA_END=1077 /DNA_ORIENTATION=-